MRYRQMARGALTGLETARTARQFHSTAGEAVLSSNVLQTRSSRPLPASDDILQADETIAREAGEDHDRAVSASD